MSHMTLSDKAYPDFHRIKKLRVVPLNSEIPLTL